MMTDPDSFDPEKLPFGKRAGDNKFHWQTCPTCDMPPTHPTKDQYVWGGQIPAMGFYLFRNEISAMEYYISGMCQHCQDKVFGKDNEEADENIF